jgi:hypothetical protein
MTVDDRVAEKLAAGHHDEARRIYRFEADMHRSSASSARTAIAIVYVAMLGLFGVGGYVGLSRNLDARVTLRELDTRDSMEKSRRRAIHEAQIMADVGAARSAIDLAAAIALVVVTLRSRNAFTSRRRLQDCRPVKSDALPKVHAIVDELCRAMEISPRIAYLLPTRTRGIAPSVHVSGDQIDLVVPPRLVVLAAKRPAVARAMLAHELAHVAQGDSAFWSLAVAFATSVKRVLSPLLWFSMVGTAVIAVLFGIAARGHVGEIVEPSTTLLFIVFGFCVPLAALACIRWVLRLRLRSEQLADVAAIVYGEPRGLCEATQLLIDLGTADPWHESPDARAFRAKLVEDAVANGAR